MPWQNLVVDVALEVDARGVLRYPIVVVTVPRQSGKTTLLRAIMAHCCLTVADASCWLTAQKRNDARDTWLEIVKRLERSVLRTLIKIRRANGSESVTWPLGGELRIFAPSEDGLHGKTTRKVAVDEAWAFSADQGAILMQAIVPTQATTLDTAPGAQVWIVSTAGTARSAWLRQFVDDCRAALDAGQPAPAAYFEWCIPEDTTDLEDLDVYAAHHPAIGYTISRRALEAARAAMKNISEFARAYGNFWTSAASFAINPALWDAARTVEPIGSGPVALAAEVNADRSGGVIVAAGHTRTGAVAVELIDARAGVGWIVPRLEELARKHRVSAVAIDPHGPARTVHTALKNAKGRPLPLLEFTAGDLVEAHSEFVDGIAAGTVRHRPVTGLQLDDALAAATVRVVREQEVLSRLGTEDGKHPAALVAAELAAYALAHPPPMLPAPAIATATR
ncbi:terminase large subunit domain-containing protein [Streptomyces sp. NPDC051546]|uniref:terminase large subunit domain-containing protein n=1 Tax=Streptomyces sp. NPDC051546 TaxID=3365655 RepID=UPI003797B4F7